MLMVEAIQTPRISSFWTVFTALPETVKSALVCGVTVSCAFGVTAECLLSSKKAKKPMAAKAATMKNDARSVYLFLRRRRRAF